MAYALPATARRHGAHRFEAPANRQADMTSLTNSTGIASSHPGNGQLAPTTAMLRTLAYSAALLLIAISASWAEDQTITVERGTPFPLSLEAPFDTFLVGNPDVIDVHSRGDRSVIVEGIAPGVSNIVFIDERMIAIANVRILVCDTGAPRSDGRNEADCEPRSEITTEKRTRDGMRHRPHFPQRSH